LGIQLYKEPVLENAILVAGWPGVGNIGTTAAETLVKQLGAEELGEIEAWDFFYPKKASIRSGVLETLEFPGNKFYFKKLERRDVIIFVGEEEPGDDGAPAHGEKAYQMGNLILDVAQKFGCRRIYTSCAGISSSYHGFKSKVWAATSHDYLKKEAQGYKNTILRSAAEGNPRYSSIPGMKGLLLGIAGTRGMEAICLMGEIPDYLTRVPLPYPRASKAVFEVLCDLLGVNADNAEIDDMISRLDSLIEGVVEQFSPEIKERIAQRKSTLQAAPETITEEDESWIKEHLDDLFKKGGGSE
jgi:uncharacterized protein